MTCDVSDNDIDNNNNAAENDDKTDYEDGDENDDDDVSCERKGENTEAMRIMNIKMINR